MFDKFFVGGDVISSVNNGKYKPVSRVTLFLDDTNVLTAGDDTGREIAANCPHATQKMVENLLASLRGYEYQAYEADSANIDPSAELGDGVTVGGVYSVIATLRDDGSGYASLSAPGEAELEDEYPMDGPMTQMFNRQLASTRSYIKKSVDELYLAVFGEEGSGAEASIKVQLDQITQEVKGAIGVDEETGKLLPVSSSINLALGDITAKVEGAIGVDEDGNLIPVSSSVKLALGEASISVSNGAESSTFTLKIGETSITSPEIKMTGVVTLKGLRDGTTTIDGGWIKTGTIDAERIAVSGGATDLAKILAGLESGDTVIDGGCIAANSLYANQMHLGGLLAVYDGLRSNTVGGWLGYDAGYNSGAGIGIRYALKDGAQCVCTDQAARISYTLERGGTIFQSGVTCALGSLTLDANQSIALRFFEVGEVGDAGELVQMYGIDKSSFYPSSTGQTLGTDTRKWSDVYAAGTSFSALVARVAALEAK